MNNNMNNSRVPSTNGAETITQAELAEFVALRKQCRSLNALRERLVRMLECGARVQPGRLSAVLVRQRSRRLSAAKLGALVGEDLVAIFLAEIEPTEVCRLDVGEV